MSAFGVTARCERSSVPSGQSTIWASIKIEAKGQALEKERAPLAVVLVIDNSVSMRGEPIAHALRSCEIVASLLGPRDQLGLVTFASTARDRCVLLPCDATGRSVLDAALRGIGCDPGTNVEAGLRAGAAMLASAPAGLRRVMVVLSDGQPNHGMTAPAQLAEYVRTLTGIGVSSLGFGAHHSEDVLVAIAQAASGRYAYVPDPILARIDLARAALAHGGIVADQLELSVALEPGVEILQVVPGVSWRPVAGAVRAAIGDVFVDEGRFFALELQLDIKTTRGKLARVTVAGRSPDGARHELRTDLIVDVHAGPHAIDRAAQHDIMLVRADAARLLARSHADRGALQNAADILRQRIAMIESCEGFVRNDGSLLAEMREQLEDEARGYEARVAAPVRAHYRRSAMVFTPTATAGRTARKVATRAPGILLALDGKYAGRQFQLMTETTLGRSQDNDVVLDSSMLGRRHARILYSDGEFLLQDLGSANGTYLNGQLVTMHPLRGDDVIGLGDIKLLFKNQR